MHILQYHAEIPYQYAVWSFITYRASYAHHEAIREDDHAQVKMYLFIEESAIDSGSCPINGFIHEVR